VYKARQSVLNRIVALKMPLLDRASNVPERLARFRREAEVLACLNHDPDPDFPTLYDVGEYQGHPYIVREFVEGSTLEQLVTARTLSIREGVGVLAAVARAVQRVHGRGIAHRNLHPSNILIAAGGSPKLISFGRVGLLAGSGLLPSGASSVPAESDVRALKEILGWLGAALGQPVPPPASVESLTAFAEALESYLQAGVPPRPWWRFW
jgi:serine/threonine protein kinase